MSYFRTILCSCQSKHSCPSHFQVGPKLPEWHCAKNSGAWLQDNFLSGACMYCGYVCVGTVCPLPLDTKTYLWPFHITWLAAFCNCVSNLILHLWMFNFNHLNKNSHYHKVREFSIKLQIFWHTHSSTHPCPSLSEVLSVLTLPSSLSVGAGISIRRGRTGSDWLSCLNLLLCLDLDR